MDSQTDNQQQAKTDEMTTMADHESYEKSFKTIKRGSYLTGKVVKIDDDGIYVDVGYKKEGFVPLSQLSHKKVNHPSDEVKEGETIGVVVLKCDDMEGELILSKRRADLETAWRQVTEAYKKGEPVMATVVEAVKGGLLVDLGLRGFVPASQVDIRPVKDLQDYVGEALNFKVIELDEDRRKVVLSRKKLLLEERSKLKEKTLSNLYEGQIIKGKVARLTDFGAFVNLGGVDGLVHISEISWKRIKHPSEILNVGEEIDVMVLKVDLKKERISLSIRQALPDPWSTVAGKMQIGDVVKGIVTKLAKKYVFVEVTEGVEGVVPIGELANRRIQQPEDVVKENQEVNVKILDMKPDARRMLLSVKQAQENYAPREEVQSFTSASTSSGGEGSATIGDILKAKMKASEESTDGK